MPTCVYRLTFKTQLHLGRASGPTQKGKLGLEKTETYIPADTLFSALCHTWATFYSTESLTEFLNQYTAESALLPFMLTSAFPFAHDIYCFPHVKSEHHQSARGSEETSSAANAKKTKRIQFVSRDIFHDIISGNPPEFKEEDLITGEKIWMRFFLTQQLYPYIIEQTSSFTNQRHRTTISCQDIIY